MSYFADEFGFNPNETVALLGAHTLGSANTQNSGFKAANTQTVVLSLNINTGCQGLRMLMFCMICRMHCQKI